MVTNVILQKSRYFNQRKPSSAKSLILVLTGVFKVNKSAKCVPLVAPWYVINTKTAAHRYSVCRGRRSSAMGCKIASSSSRGRSGTCAARAPAPRPAPRPVRRACVALRPARPTSHASATSISYRSGSRLPNQPPYL